MTFELKRWSIGTGAGFKCLRMYAKFAVFSVVNRMVNAQSNADVLACETVPNIDDVRALTRVANENVVDKDVWLSMVCRDEVSLSR